MKNINDKLPEQMKVAPLEEGEKVMYILCESGGWDPVNKRPMKPAGHILSGRYTINDKWNNRRVIIQNVNGYRDVEQGDGTMVAIPTEAMVRFPKSNVVTCTNENFDLYVFMERHPRNESNPWRDKSQTPIFRRIDARAEAQIKLDKEELELDARILVRDTVSIEKLRAMAKGCGIGGYDVAEPATLKASLTNLAKNMPLKVIKAGNNQKLIKKINIIEGQKMVILGYDESEKIWFWRDDPSKRQILQLDENQDDAVNALVTHFSSKGGQTSYRTLVDKIKKLE